MPLLTADRVPWSPLLSPGVDPSRGDILETTLVHTQLSPRNLADRMTEREGEFLS